MPLYDTSTNAKFAIYPGDIQQLQTNENITVNGTAAVQRNVPNSVMQPAKAVNISVQFASNPGAFELDIQDSDTDSDAAYQSIPNAIIITATQDTGANSDGTFWARFELSPFTGNWVRPFWKTAPANNVKINVFLGR